MNFIVAKATLYEGEFEWGHPEKPEYLSLEIRWGCEGEVTLIKRHNLIPDYKDGYDFSYHSSLEKCLGSIEYLYGRRMRRKMQDSIEHSIEHIDDAFTRLGKFKQLHCDTKPDTDEEDNSMSNRTQMTVGKMRKMLEDETLSDDTPVFVDGDTMYLRPLGQYTIVHCPVSPVDKQEYDEDYPDSHRYDRDSAKTAIVITV